MALSTCALQAQVLRGRSWIVSAEGVTDLSDPQITCEDLLVGNASEPLEKAHK